ncbi:hypothetical protein YB2330_004356 [Saitoella coloradoensis]
MRSALASLKLPLKTHYGYIHRLHTTATATTSTTKPLTILFPGQGSLSPHLLAPLLSTFPIARETLDEASELISTDLTLYITLPPSSRTSLKGPLGTHIAQPLIFASSIAIMRVLETEFKLDVKKAKYVMGHSLGEYAALTAAGVLTFEEAVKIVGYRGLVMQAASMSNPGGMFAVSCPAEHMGRLERFAESIGDVGIANYNSKTQVIIAGSRDGLEKAKSEISRAARLGFAPEVEGARRVAVRMTDLEVSGAFHSMLMAEAARDFKQYVNGPDISLAHDARLDEWKPLVISNVTAKPHETSNLLIEDLHSHLTRPVRWRQSTEYILDANAKSSESQPLSEPEPMRFLSIGPGDTLATLLAKDLAQGVGRTALCTGVWKEGVIRSVSGAGEWGEEERKGVREAVDFAMGRAK